MVAQVKQSKSTGQKIVDRMADSGVSGDVNVSKGMGPTRVNHHIHNHGHEGPTAMARDVRQNVGPDKGRGFGR